RRRRARAGRRGGAGRGAASGAAERGARAAARRPLASCNSGGKAWCMLEPILAKGQRRSPQLLKRGGAEGVHASTCLQTWSRQWWLQTHSPRAVAGPQLLPEHARCVRAAARWKRARETSGAAAPTQDLATCRAACRTATARAAATGTPPHWAATGPTSVFLVP
ncbi:MAG: hypothetical protein J3K34DRAFT_148588, partial [Monoraphidium minutum]